MAYSSLNFAGYSDLSKNIDKDCDLHDATLRAMIHAENSVFFDALGKIVARYAAAKDEQKLSCFMQMIEDGLNDVIDILSQRSGSVENV